MKPGTESQQLLRRAEVVSKGLQSQLHAEETMSPRLWCSGMKSQKKPAHVLLENTNKTKRPETQHLKSLTTKSQLHHTTKHFQTWEKPSLEKNTLIQKKSDRPKTNAINIASSNPSETSSNDVERNTFKIERKRSLLAKLGKTYEVRKTFAQQRQSL